MNTENPRTYQHTQHSPLHVLLYSIAAGLLWLGWTTRQEQASAIICVFVAAMMILAALSFRDLTVRDEGDFLAIRYGPLRAFQKRIPYAEITSVEVGRSSLIDGWGIHWIPGRGWTFNLWGYECAKLTVNSNVIRIGSDDAGHLVDFLRRRITEHVGNR